MCAVLKTLAMYYMHVTVQNCSRAMYPHFVRSLVHSLSPHFFVPSFLLAFVWLFIFIRTFNQTLQQHNSRLHTVNSMFIKLHTFLGRKKFVFDTMKQFILLQLERNALTNVYNNSIYMLV